MTKEDAIGIAKEIDVKTRSYAQRLENAGDSLRVVEVARYLMGQGVVEATGRNDGVPQYLFSDGEALPWCASFVLYCHEVAGLRIPGNRWCNRSAAALYLEAKKGNVFFAAPEIGDVAFFRRGPRDATTGHVGIVETIDDDLGFSTIEGNFSNTISRRVHHYKEADLLGFGRFALWIPF